MAEFDDQLNSLLSNPESMAQIMNLAQSLSGGASQSAPSAPPPPPPSNAGGEGVGNLLGGIDSKTLLKFLPLIQSLGGSGDSHSKQLLYALRPYLRQERQAKVDRAVQLARMICIGKQLLSEWGHEDV